MKRVSNHPTIDRNQTTAGHGMMDGAAATISPKPVTITTRRKQETEKTSGSILENNICISLET